MAASSVDEMERGWRSNTCAGMRSMGDRSDDMERKDEAQGAECSVVERHRKKRDHEGNGASRIESKKRVKVRSKRNIVSEWKVVLVVDETTGPHLHPI